MTAALRVAGVQLDIAWEDPPESFARADAAIGRATAAGARLIVLPEMYATGFSMNAEAMARHAGAVAAHLAAAARRHDVWVLGGFADPGRPRPRNAAALFDPDGAERLRYHKIHPFSLAREHEHFDGGRALHTVTIEAGVRLTPLVCYDLRFPEPFRAAAEQTDLFVVIANWPEPRRDAWSTLLRARAIENQAFVLGVNREGRGGGLVYAGDSALHGPLGAQRAGAIDGLVVGEVDSAEVTDARARFSFLADRRPDVYDAW